MKITFCLTVLGVCSLAGCTSSSDLGPLSNFYHDCSGAHGRNRRYVHETLKRALEGDYAALHAVFTDPRIYDTGDNEAYTELPCTLLQALGDDRYAAFVTSQPQETQDFALMLSPEDVRTYPKTSKLFYTHQRKL